jgi:hypothetical protein
LLVKTAEGKRRKSFLLLPSAHCKIIHDTEFNMNFIMFRKKAIIIFLAVLLLCGNNVFADDENENQDEILNSSVTHKNKERRFTFQSSPHLFAMDFSLLLLYPYTRALLIVMDLETQYKINDIYNVSFTASFWKSNSRNDFAIDLKPMFIFRPFKTGLEGFYVGLYPTVGWHHYKVVDGQNYDKLFTIVGFGVNTGYKFVFKRGFTMQLGTGIGKSWIIPDLPDSLKSKDNTYLSSDIRMITKYIDVYIMDFKIGYSF